MPQESATAATNREREQKIQEKFDDFALLLSITLRSSSSWGKAAWPGLISQKNTLSF